MNKFHRMNGAGHFQRPMNINFINHALYDDDDDSCSLSDDVCTFVELFVCAKMASMNATEQRVIYLIVYRIIILDCLIKCFMPVTLERT